MLSGSSTLPVHQKRVKGPILAAPGRQRGTETLWTGSYIFDKLEQELRKAAVAFRFYGMYAALSEIILLAHGLTPQAVLNLKP
jgi:hypothetical protein